MEVALFTSKDNFETILQQFSLQYFHPFLDFYAVNSTKLLIYF